MKSQSRPIVIRYLLNSETVGKDSYPCALGLSVIYCCITWRLKTTTMVLSSLTVSLSWEFRKGLAVQFWLGPSHGATVSWWLGSEWQVLEHLETGRASLSIHRVSGLLLVLCPHGWFGLPYCMVTSGGWRASEGVSQGSGADMHRPDLIQRLHFQQYRFDHWTHN